MGKNEEIRALLNEAEEIMQHRVIAEKDGEIYVTPHDAAILNSAAAMEGEGTGMRTYNPDGSICGTGKKIHAVNPDYFFANRYKISGKPGSKKMNLVCGARDNDSFLAIMYGQKDGRLRVSYLPCYVFSRNDEGKIVLEKVTTVSASEFISDFHNSLNHKDMAEILPQIFEGGNDVTAESMPI